MDRYLIVLKCVVNNTNIWECLSVDEAITSVFRFRKENPELERNTACIYKVVNERLVRKGGKRNIIFDRELVMEIEF